MTVKPAEIFGKGIEVICRFRAVGSFFYVVTVSMLRKGNILMPSWKLPLRMMRGGDPPITDDALDMLGILSLNEYKVLKDLTRKLPA